MIKHLKTALLATTALGLLATGPAHAASNQATLDALQSQIEALQKQISQLQAKEKARTRKEKSYSSKAQKKGSEILPGVDLQIGGFVTLDTVYRDKNFNADVGTSFASIPLANSTNNSTDEFRASARVSRISLLASGDIDSDSSLEAYFEMDFAAAARTSNSVKTNSYSPRIRQGFVSYDRKDWGLYVLGGQTWSLATMNRVGMTGRKIAGVKTIDASTVVGFDYARLPQLRVVKTFDNNWTAGLSLEDPEVNLGAADTPTNVTSVNSGGAFMNADSNYSLDYAPDVIAKVAYDSSYGHFEAFGLARFFRDVYSTNGHNNYATGLGVGAGAYVPIIDKKLDLMATFMTGKGIGRYGASALADIGFDAAGKIKPLTQVHALAGLIGHPAETWDLYLYAGLEKVMRKNIGSSGTDYYGYGSTGIDNSGCYTLGGTCNAQTKSVMEITPGFWKTFYKGDYGSMKFGAQYAFARRDTFSGANGLAPHAYEHSIFFSFRYFPF